MKNFQSYRKFPGHETKPNNIISLHIKLETLFVVFPHDPWKDMGEGWYFELIEFKYNFLMNTEAWDSKH